MRATLSFFQSPGAILGDNHAQRMIGVPEAFFFPSSGGCVQLKEDILSDLETELNSNPNSFALLVNGKEEASSAVIHVVRVSFVFHVYACATEMNFLRLSKSKQELNGYYYNASYIHGHTFSYDAQYMHRIGQVVVIDSL